MNVASCMYAGVSTVVPGASPTPGFADPVHDAQACYRLALRAMARPVLRWTMDAGRMPLPPAPLGRVMAALALTLCDQDTTVWLSVPLRTRDVRNWLRFHTSCPMTDNPAEAAFALAAHGSELPRLDAFRQGDARWPDRSTTILLDNVRFIGDAACPGLTAEGPGIRERETLICSGLPEDFPAQWAASRAAYPLGVDMVLIDGFSLAGLPRTTRLLPNGTVSFRTSKESAACM